MQRLGVLGLGRMGLPIARRLSAAGSGFDVVAFDPDEQRARLAAGAGVVSAGSAREVVGQADILLTVLPGPPEFRQAMLGDDGAIARLRPGTCWLDLTSNDPRVAEEAARASEARDVHCVGAPMSGGPEAAVTGLGFFVGGAAEAVVRVRGVLDALAEPGGVREAGPRIRDGYLAKLLVNQLWFGQVAAVTEALLLGQSLGLEPLRMRGLLQGSAADSAFVSRHLDTLLGGDYAPSFGLDRVVEELDTLAELADETGTPFEVSTLVARLHREALDRFGAVDGEMLGARLLEERAGRRLADGSETPAFPSI